MVSPLDKYRELLDKGEIQTDQRQLHVVEAFETLHKQLFDKPSGFWFFKKSFTPRGLYIHGHVGRGKTFLMDLFVESLPAPLIMRKHFHEFMLWMHGQLRQRNKQSDPIDDVIKNLSQSTQVLCLDEFLVLDITDAMILARILQALQKYKITLVTTSNIEPEDLYYGGLQRRKFMPAIEWIQTHMETLHLDGDNDFRQFHSGKQDLWMHPVNAENEQLFEQQFSDKIAAEKISIDPIEVNKRQIPVIKRSDNHIMFEFESLCMDARSANDYLDLCQRYKSIFILINHKIADEDRNTARRFITLVDVFYDNRQPLYVLSVVDFTQIYSGNELKFEMQRTHSRLTEMQSF